MLLYAKDFLGVEKSGVATSEFLLRAIEEVRHANVLQVVTDNASNCKATGRKIGESTQAYLLVSMCGSHPQSNHLKILI